jgi:NAD dependent epimerase/dehydratase family enzyme
MKYLITGGSGLIGSAITKLLLEKNEDVNWLTSSKKNKIGVKSFNWNIYTNQIDENCFQDVDVIIHLAGAGIADKKWTVNRKKELIDSRIKSTQLLFETLGIRVVKIRTGIVLSKDGGYLKSVAAPAKYGLAAALGNGKMITSWIHISDMAHLFLFASKNEKMKGVYNGVAPNPVTNYEITKQIAKALNRPFFLPNIPAFLLKIAFGEMAAVILMSQNISSEKIEKANFKFEFEDIKDALENIYK